MRFHELKNSDIDKIIKIYKESPTRLEAQELIAKEMNTSLRTVRRWAKKLRIIEAPEAEQLILDAEKRELKGHRYIFTWAQSETPIHQDFFQNIKKYADHIDAEIGVIAGRYRNPDNIYARPEEGMWWADEVLNYLTLNRHNVHKYLSILADVEVIPTASTPMTGFEGFESEVSVIIGHPRVQMKVVPTLEGYRKKEIFTTGACTIPNYIKKKTGKKAEFHHTLGFVVVETDGEEFYMRHVTAQDDGSFIDLNTSVDGDITEGNFIDLYACGDKHFGEEDENMEMTSRYMISKLKPKYVRLDDIFNGHSVNPHEGNDPVKRFERHKDGELILDNELTLLCSNLSWYAVQDFKVVIPRCNHDIFLDRYVASQDWRKDIPNALSYMKCASLLLEGKAPKGLIPYFINLWYPDMIVLSDNESFRISGWEQSVHGHIGANGSRGSVIQFKRLSTKMITAHTHSPSRYDGVVTVGTNTLLRVGYNRGPSSWMHCDAIVHRNGKSQQLIYHNYKCTTLL